MNTTPTEPASSPLPTPFETPVYEVLVEKVADKGTIRDHPIFTGYTIRGFARALPVAGERFAVLRTERNGVAALGVFSTSAVQSVEETAEKGVLWVHTANSAYRVTHTIVESPLTERP